MKRLLPLLLLPLLSCSQYIKPRVDITIANKSHEVIRNIELDYPGGSYGRGMLAVYDSDHHTVEIDQPNCLLTLKFDDTKGDSHSRKDMNLGAKCPSKISVVIDAQLAISAEPTQ